MITWSLLEATLRIATPLILAAIGGVFSHQVGIFNFTLEGLMLFGAFFAVWAAIASNSAGVGVVVAGVTVMVISLIFADVLQRFKASFMVAALGVNIVALGMTTFLLRSYLGQVGGVFSPVKLEEMDLPFLSSLGGLGTALAHQSPLTYFALIAGPAAYLFLNRTVLGLQFRATGANPEAAAAAGIKVARIRYAALALTGLFCGLAGAQLSLGFLSQFTEGMTNGRGLIAFAAVVFGGSGPIGAFAAALLFGFAEAFGNRLQGVGIPGELVVLVPYVLAIIALAVASRRQLAKAAE